MEWVIIIGLGWLVYALANKKKEDRQVDEDNDLAEFRITVSTSSSFREDKPSKNKKPAVWNKPGESVKVGDYEITGGFIYIGGRLKSEDGYDTDSSLIDPTLKVNSNSPDYSGGEMGYWPSYSSISPKSRAAYLEWLVSDRSDPDCYIGYVFLYFYGLERRLLIDGQKNNLPKEELLALIHEVQRLRDIYGSNRSFNGYSTNLIAHAWVLYDKESTPDPSLIFGKRNFSSVFLYQLGQCVADGKPVPPLLALAWVKSHPDYNLRTPARRCEKEFDQLFSIKYQQKHGEGLLIKPNKTKVELEYNTASSSLMSYRWETIKLDLPDPSRLKGPVKKLMDIAEQCIVELEPFSRFLGRQGNSRDALASISYLPDALAEQSESKQFLKLKEWLEDIARSSNGVVSTKEFLACLGDEAPVKINKKESEMITGLVEKAGFGMAPDIRFHQAKPDLDGKIVVFSEPHGAGFDPSHAFNQVGTIIRLGAMVASIDGHIDGSEIKVLEDLIVSDDQLNDKEKGSLKAYLHWRLNSKINMTGLKARLESISNREKSAVSHILISVALADGNVDPKEIKQLEKLYTSLGLDKSLVTSDIHQLTTKRRVPAASTDAGSEGEGDGVSVFQLNRDLLKVHEEETQGAKAVLESIFVDESVENEPEEADQPVEVPASSAALDSNHSTLYQKLIGKEQWSLDEVKNLCEELNLMLEGAIEVINDWAYDIVDAPLVDIGSDVFVDLEIAEEIKGS